MSQTREIYAEIVRTSKAVWRQCHKINKCMLRWRETARRDEDSVVEREFGRQAGDDVITYRNVC